MSRAGGGASGSSPDHGAGPEPSATGQAQYTPEGYFLGGLKNAIAGRGPFIDMPPGLHVSRRSLPPGVAVIEDYLSPRDCQHLLRYAAGQASVPSTVHAPGSSGDGAVTRLSADRVTDYIAVDGIAGEVDRLMRDIFRGQAAMHYGRQIEWYEKPELLRYRTGGLYRPHADADNFDPLASQWIRAADRDVSVLLYLNDDFEGGELEFPNFGLRLKPRGGMLVMFPSDHRYVHAAMPVTAGERLVLVCWAAARGSPRAGSGLPEGATRLE